MFKNFKISSLFVIGILFSQGLLAGCCCPPTIITIDGSGPTTLPYTISQSNTTYCVTKNLSFASGISADSAIIVSAGVHDIIIDFNGFDLTVGTPALSVEQGIEMQGTTALPVRNVTIKNGSIVSFFDGTALENNGISLTKTTGSSGSVDRVLIENMIFTNFRRCIAERHETDTALDLTIRTCQFSQDSDPVRSISLATIQGCLIEDCSITQPNSFSGVGILFANNSINGFIRRCTFRNIAGNCINIQSVLDPNFTFQSANFLIDECQFNNNFVDVSIVGADNTKITSCVFLDSATGGASIGFSKVIGALLDQADTPIATGLLVENCTFATQSQLFGSGLIALGEFGPCRDAIIKNCTFTNLNAPSYYADIQATQINGLLVENCIFDSNSSGRNPDGTPVLFQGTTQLFPEKGANIHFGMPSEVGSIIDGANVTDVTIRGCQIGGGAQVGIYAETGVTPAPNQRITIEDSSITATEVGILFENTLTSTITENQVRGVTGNQFAPGQGIVLAGPLSQNPTATSSCNALLENTITNNQEGIVIECGAKGNLLKENNVFNNSNHQIVVKDRRNKCVDNTTFLKPCKPCGQSVQTPKITGSQNILIANKTCKKKMLGIAES